MTQRTRWCVIFAAPSHKRAVVPSIGTTGLSKKYWGSSVGQKADAELKGADLGSLRAEGWDEPQSDGVKE